MKKIPFNILIILIFFPLTLLSQELEIYNLKNDGFISLTHEYYFSNYQNSSVIAEKYLDDKVDSVYYHKLSPKNRETFFQRVDILESDKLFLYNYILDTVITYQVRDLKLIAKLNPYGAVSEIPPPHTFMIGFDLDEKDIEIFGDYYYRTFIYIGKENPFKNEKLQPMRWKKIDRKFFPLNVDCDNNHGDWFKKHSVGESYKFESNGLGYFLQNLHLDEYNNKLNARHLIVIKSKTDSIIFDKVYYDSESKSIVRIKLVDEKNNNLPYQWTGKLFKNKPPVVFGFLSHSFGCPRIYFLSKEENSIIIRCDNRH